MEQIPPGLSILANGVSRLNIENNILVDGVVVDDTWSEGDGAA
jgi:hypothetical protein